MAVRDTWHRALVYFGLAEDPDYRYDDDRDYYDEPDTVSDEAVAPPPPRRQRGGGSNVRRLRREEPSEIDDIFGDPPPRRNLRPVSNGGDNVQVHFVTPRNFNDAQEVADKFKEGLPVIMNLEAADREIARRLIDFASGLCYGLNGSMEKVATGVYLLKAHARQSEYDG